MEQSASAGGWLSGKTILLALITAVIVRFLYRIRARHISGLPVPTYDLPFFGSLFYLTPHRMENFLHFIEDGFQKAKGLAFTTGLVATPPVLWTTDPAHIEYILKGNFKNYEKGAMFHAVFEELLGNGIFNSDGNQWRVQRQTASHLFTMRKLKDNMTAVFVEHGKEFITKLDSLKPNQSVDLQALYFAFTLDSICEIAFGVKLGALTGEDVPFMRAFDSAQWLAEKRWYAPWWPINRVLAKYLGLTSEVTLAKDVQLMNEFAAGVIANRRREMKENPDTVNKRADLLSMFMLQKDENGEPFSDVYLRDVVMNFVIAGRDTTAQALSWMTHSIAQNPAVERSLHEEVDSYFSSLASESGGDAKQQPTSADLDSAYRHLANVELHYMNAVTSESLRLYPSVPKDPKFAVTDDVLPGGLAIPAGTIVVYVPFAQGRRKELWGEDACEFKPSRWIDSNNQFKRDESPFKFSAFQAGPRLCLGKHVAYLETKILTAMLARKFKFKHVPGHKVEPLHSVTLPMKTGLLMTVEPRTEFFDGTGSAGSFTAFESTLDVTA